MPVILVLGLASGRTIRLSVLPGEEEENFLNWLRKKGITIASSCNGEGVCKKCVIQNGWLTCEMTVAGFLEKEPSGEVRVGYL